MVMRRRCGLVVAALALCALALPTSAAAKRADNHCISPDGTDLNALYATRDAFITPFCTEAHVGDWWRPVLRFVVGSNFDVTPQGYEPIGATPLEDFFLKFVSAEYVVDPGTRRERHYSFAVDELFIDTGSVPDGTEFARWSPRLHPLPPGPHTLAIYGTTTADFWDGVGLDPAVNFVPAGTSLAVTEEFTVIRRK